MNQQSHSKKRMERKDWQEWKRKETKEGQRPSVMCFHPEHLFICQCDLRRSLSHVVVKASLYTCFVRQRVSSSAYDRLPAGFTRYGGHPPISQRSSPRSHCHTQRRHDRFNIEIHNAYTCPCPLKQKIQQRGGYTPCARSFRELAWKELGIAPFFFAFRDPGGHT